MSGLEQLTISLNQLFGWSTAISCFVSIGICALWSIGFNRIKEGQKAEFQKQIEKQKGEFCKQLEILKAKNEKTNYVTKIQFDAEFKMYQELSEACYNMVIDMLDLFTNKPELIEKQKDPVHNSEICAISKKSNYDLQHILSRYSAFISKEIYESYSDLRIRCKKQTDAFYEIYIRQQEPSLSIDEYIRKSSELFNIYFVTTEKLREYLQTLRVTDGNNE